MSDAMSDLGWRVIWGCTPVPIPEVSCHVCGDKVQSNLRRVESLVCCTVCWEKACDLFSEKAREYAKGGSAGQ